MFANSFASYNVASRGAVAWWPSELSLDGYHAVFENKYLVSGFTVTVLRTIVATSAHVLFTSFVFLCDEPPQSDRQKDLHEDRNDHDVFQSAVLIPNFILMNKLHLYNTFWVFVLPGMFTFYNMIIFISFFKTIPESLLESARLDGASEFRIYWQILLPNCKAVLATIGLYSAVYNWNDYYLGVIYIRNKTLQPLQTILYKLLAETTMSSQQQAAMVALGGQTSASTIKFAAMVVATLPILFIYPFIQKYLVKGVMIGSIKG